MAQQHRRSTSFPLITPFNDFILRVDSLSDSQLAYNLRTLQSDHNINHALRRLYTAVEEVKYLDGVNGPRESWNVPFLDPGTQHRQLTNPYTPPRTPSSDVSCSAAANLEHRIDDLRRKLAQANKIIEEQRHDLAAMVEENKTMSAKLADRNSAVLELRQTIAEQHQLLSRHGLTRHSSASDLDAKQQRRKTMREAMTTSDPLDDKQQRRKTMPEPLTKTTEPHNLDEKALLAQLAHAKALLHSNQPHEAETIARNVLKHLDNDPPSSAPSTPNPITRSATLLLCKSLRRQHPTSPTALREAERLYRKSCPSVIDDSTRSSFAALPIDEKDFQLTSALALATLQAETRSWIASISTLTKCHALDQHLSSSMREKLEKTALSIAGAAEAGGQPLLGAKAFEIACPSSSPSSGSLPDDALVLAKRLGETLSRIPGYESVGRGCLRRVARERSGGGGGGERGR